MTQNQLVLEHLEKYGRITSREAYENYGIMRLASRISDLKRQGYKISGEWIKVATRRGEDAWVKDYKLL